MLGLYIYSVRLFKDPRRVDFLTWRVMLVRAESSMEWKGL